MMDAKEREKQYKREWYQKKKQDPDWVERGRQRKREYREKNKQDPVWAERQRQSQREYIEKKRQDPEWIEREKQIQREYRANNKEKRVAYIKIYSQTANGKKRIRIAMWKYLGVICDDWDELYEKHTKITHCEDCGVELTEDKIMTRTTKCLDHDHKTGLYRGTVCHCCNLRRG